MVMFLFVIAYIGPRGELASEHRRPWQVAVAAIASGAILVEIALVVGRSGFDARRPWTTSSDRPSWSASCS